ncbi:hypothetical protein PIB30_061701 [Stylosanthes scabra]|uniref:Uncharacterized protein n=1 Tax=Stylosanthes scabra TaxID=79078 RepID=A0ABU6RL97_9FABA|nr:hypothetical protein [Stylosanthes scabra]
MGSFARRPGATISDGLLSLTTGTTSGTTRGPESIRFRSCPPTTPEYADWWVVACCRRFLSPDRLLQDPRGAQLPDDVPPAATQGRDPIVLPRDSTACGRRARMQRPDIQRKGEGASTSGRSDAQPGGEDVDEEAKYGRQEDIPEGVGAQDQGGDDPEPH